MVNLRVHTICLLVLQLNNFIQISALEEQAALFIFGDSLFDNGNNNWIKTTPSAQANFPPYGETFFNYPSGRFSDGRVIPDFIAEYAELPTILPYLHPDNRQYEYGVNFASGGAGALVQTNHGFIIDLKTQAGYFKEVRKKLGQKLGDVEANALLSKAVYMFSIIGNDYGTLFVANYSHQQFVDMVVGNITTAIEEIYEVGGRKFGLVNVGPLNCYPLLRILQNGSLADCQKGEASEIARLHNNVLLKRIQELEKQLEGFKYSVFDLNNALTEVMNYPSKYGFEEGEVACCGGGRYRGDYSCGGKRGIAEYQLCENVREYVFFDAAHHTDRAAGHFAQLWWNGSMNITKPYNLKALFQV